MLEGGKFNYFKVCQKIINDPTPELPAEQFSPEMQDFLKRWYRFDHLAWKRKRNNVLLRKH